MLTRGGAAWGGARPGFRPTAVRRRGRRCPPEGDRDRLGSARPPLGRLSSAPLSRFGRPGPARPARRSQLGSAPLGHIGRLGQFSSAQPARPAQFGPARPARLRPAWRARLGRLDQFDPARQFRLGQLSSASSTQPAWLRSARPYRPRSAVSACSARSARRSRLGLLSSGRLGTADSAAKPGHDRCNRRDGPGRVAAVTVRVTARRAGTRPGSPSTRAGHGGSPRRPQGRPHPVPAGLPRPPAPVTALRRDALPRGPRPAPPP